MWNPAENYCLHIDIETYSTSENNFLLNGELFTLQKSISESYFQ